MSFWAGSLDTNVLLRMLVNDVPAQHRSATQLLRSTKGQFAVADAAIIEMAFVLDGYYRLSRAQVVEAVEAVMLVTQFNCNRSLFRRVLPLYFKHQSLSFEDCCLAVYAELNDAIPLWTFDKKLAKQAPSAKLVPLA